MLWFVCFIIPQVLIDCPILKRLVLISCVSSVSDLTHKCKQFIGTTCNTINVLTWMLFLQFVILFTTDHFNTASIWNPSKTTLQTPSAENHFVKKDSQQKCGVPHPLYRKIDEYFRQKKGHKGLKLACFDQNHTFL